MNKTRAYAARSATAPLAPFTIERRDPGPADVEIEIIYCGVCHTDLHQARNDWRGTTYPVVPGHEILGRVTRVGGTVTKVAPGDTVGVGCMVYSCRTCESCQADREQYCERGPTWTYNSEDTRFGGMTYGGYSERIVVDQSFVLRIPAALDPVRAAPLLCAGITTYSPLKHWNARNGRRIGVVGLGGLGHMAVKIAHAMGADVVVFTTSPAKKTDAVRLGATEAVLSRDAAEMKRHESRFDLVLDTVSAPHDLTTFVTLLKVDGTLVQVGLPADPLPVSIQALTGKRRCVAGSTIGGIRETQEMLEFCAGHGIACDVEPIRIQQIDDAFDRLLTNDVKYRFVIDMASLKA